MKLSAIVLDARRFLGNIPDLIVGADLSPGLKNRRSFAWKLVSLNRQPAAMGRMAVNGKAKKKWTGS